MSETWHTAVSETRFLESCLYVWGFAGNHPLRTRSFCSKTSHMLQNDENAITANTADRKTPSVINAAIDATTQQGKYIVDFQS